MKKSKLELENNSLKNELRVLKASELFTICEAYRNINKCGQDRYMASGVTITLKNINQDKNTIVEEVCIADGLSLATITAIKQDIKRSYDLKNDFPLTKI